MFRVVCFLIVRGEFVRKSMAELRESSEGLVGPKMLNQAASGSQSITCSIPRSYRISKKSSKFSGVKLKKQIGSIICLFEQPRNAYGKLCTAEM